MAHTTPQNDQGGGDRGKDDPADTAAPTDVPSPDPVGGDPRDTAHPTGAQQAAENAENEPAG